MRAFPELNISEEYLVYEIVKKYILSQEFVYKKVYLKKVSTYAPLRMLSQRCRPPLRAALRMPSAYAFYVCPHVS